MRRRKSEGCLAGLSGGGLLGRLCQVVVALVGGILLLCLVLAFVLPLIFSFLPSTPGTPYAGGTVGNGGGSGMYGGFSLIFSSRVLRVAFRTLVLALLSTLLALVIGIPAAFFTATRSFPGRRLLLSLSAVPLCVPPLLVALGYVMFWGMQGVANGVAQTLLGLESPPFTFLYSSLGIVLAQGFYNFPLVMKTCGDCWSQLHRGQHDAAVLLGASPFRVFRTVTVVQLLPSIATAAMMVFLYCFFSFVLVLLFGGVGTSVLEVEIYQAARSSLNFPLASALAVVETAVAVLVVWLYNLAEVRGRENRGLALDAAGFGRRPLGGFGEVAGFALLAVVVVLFFLLPLLQLVVSALTARSLPAGQGLSPLGLSLMNFRSLFSRHGFFISLKNTLVTSALSSVLAVVAALFLAVALKEWERQRNWNWGRGGLRRGKNLFGRGGRRFGHSGLARILPLLPMAVSSVVMGFGATRLMASWWPGLTGSPWMLVLLQAALHWPLAFRQISVAMDKIPPAMEDAATMLSSFPLDRVFRIYLPLCKRSLLSALGFCLALGCGDTTLPLVLAIPRFETLALYTYNLAGAYRFGEACCSGLVLAAVSMPLFFLGDRGRLPSARTVGQLKKNIFKEKNHG